MDDQEETEDGEISKQEPSILPDAAHLNAFIAKASSRSVTDGKGPSPKLNIPEKSPSDVNDSNWEWDGTVDEDAHLGLD